MRILFLDDCSRRTAVIRSELPWITAVSTANAAIDKLSRESFDVVFLDHDLDGGTYQDSASDNCGMAVVRWLITNKSPIQRIIIHSHNEVAREVMASTLCDAGYEAKTIPFIYLKPSGIIDKLVELHMAQT